MGEKRKHRGFWLDKTGRKRPLGRTMCSWKGKNVMDVLGTVWQRGLDPSGSGQTIDGKKVQVKCTLVQALRLCTGRTAHRRSIGIALPFHDNGTRRG
jgi:hypothetical protein